LNLPKGYKSLKVETLILNKRTGSKEVNPNAKLQQTASGNTFVHFYSPRHQQTRTTSKGKLQLEVSHQSTTDNVIVSNWQYP
jgi:hypothetical protein